MTGTGQERLAIAVEPRTNTPSEAPIRSALELAREQRFAVAVQPNPALELCEVVAFGDGAIGETICRVRELCGPQSWVYEQTGDALSGAGR